jgi:hypothetical protein
MSIPIPLTDEQSRLLLRLCRSAKEGQLSLAEWLLIDGELSPREIDELCGLINAEFLLHGIEETWEPNDYGLELSHLLDAVNRRRFRDSPTMTRYIAPDILAKVIMFLPEAGGKKYAIPPVQYGCSLSLGGQLYDCRLLLDQVGLSLSAGNTLNVPIKFLRLDLVKDQLLLGANFSLWEMRYFAEGVILEVYLV